jgi:Uma2 family endonuclease
MRHRAPPPGFDELLARVRDLPEGHRGQIYDGQIHVSEPPSTARAHTLAEISAMLVAGSPLGDPVPEGWTFHSGVELAAGEERLLVADVAGWPVPKESSALTASPVRIAPAWVCEVLGRSTRAFTLTAKRRAYAEMGVAHLWIADPEAEVLEVFQNTRLRPHQTPAGSAAKWLLHACLSDERGVSAIPFEGLRFDAGDLWVPGPASRPAPSSKRASR